MRQAADILASPAAMQIRQLEALQQMAKTASTKVVFVPMQLQGDVSAQYGTGNNYNAPAASGSGSTPGVFGGEPLGRAAILHGMADV